MSKARQESINRMLVLANRIGSIVVDMQIRKAQMLTRRDTSHKDALKK